MIKKVLLFLLAFLLTGCSVNYKLDIDRELSFKENIVISKNDDSDVKSIKEFNYNVPINIEADDLSIFEKKVDGVDYYYQKKSEDKIKFSYDFNISQFNYDMFVRSCYQYVTVMNENDELLLSTSRKFLCFDKYDNLDDVTVTIYSKYRLKDTNADEASNRTYKWYLNKENANDKYLYLLLDTKHRDLTLLERISEGEFVNMFTISLVLFVVVLIVCFIFKKKGDRKNKI